MDLLAATCDKGDGGTWGQCLLPETAVILEQNNATQNAQQDIWCQDWPCGKGAACQ